MDGEATTINSVSPVLLHVFDVKTTRTNELIWRECVNEVRLETPAFDNTWRDHNFQKYFSKGQNHEIKEQKSLFFFCFLLNENEVKNERKSETILRDTNKQTPNKKRKLSSIFFAISLLQGLDWSCWRWGDQPAVDNSGQRPPFRYLHLFSVRHSQPVAQASHHWW